MADEFDVHTPDQSAGDSEARATNSSAPALTPPLVYDRDWPERIEWAKNAREDGRKARHGKPVVFDPRPLT